ncbi:MAG: hypothetical protein IIB15_03150 [Chloroflexi bacterium]|nr:hypothetical protein [Chloroflexota bacterium]MCH8109104.1 hypothetical protein [Chloroflexota bacterium]
MLHKFINTLRHLNDPSGFELYLNNIQRGGRSGVPSLEEAKRDYKAVARSEASLYR